MVELMLTQIFDMYQMTANKVFVGLSEVLLKIKH